MKITAIKDFFHGANPDGSSRKFAAGTSYNVPEDVSAFDAGFMIGAGWVVLPSETQAPGPKTRLSVEPVEVTFHPAK